MKDRLEELRERKFIGTAQLADEAARLVSRFVPRQERQSVSLVPDERTVRYYSAEGLLAPPEGKQGLNSVYGYQHLLQLLVIKRLQAEHLPIRKIRELVEGKSVDELESLLGLRPQSKAQETSKNTATEYLESLLKRSAASPRDVMDYLESLLKLPAASPQAAPPPVTVPGIAPQTTYSAWSRIEVEPGLELHIRDSYRLPVDARERQRLARKMISEIEQHGHEPGK